MKCEGCTGMKELVKVTETVPTYEGRFDKELKGFPTVIGCIVSEVFQCRNCGRISHIKSEKTYIPALID